MQRGLDWPRRSWQPVERGPAAVFCTVSNYQSYSNFDGGHRHLLESLRARGCVGILEPPRQPPQEAATQARSRGEVASPAVAFSLFFFVGGGPTAAPVDYYSFLILPISSTLSSTKLVVLKATCTGWALGQGAIGPEVVHQLDAQSKVDTSATRVVGRRGDHEVTRRTARSRDLSITEPRVLLKAHRHCRKSKSSYERMRKLLHGYLSGVVCVCEASRTSTSLTRG